MQEAHRPSDRVRRVPLVGVDAPPHRRDCLAGEAPDDEPTPRERAVIRLRFGLEDGTPLTLAEVGQRLGVSRERVRQLEADGLRKLRGGILRERLARVAA